MQSFLCVTFVLLCVFAPQNSPQRTRLKRVYAEAICEHYIFLCVLSGSKKSPRKK